MKIDLSKLDLERFHANQRNIPGLGDFVLVVPHKAMWDWNDDELHLRSLLTRPDGEVVSAGFPKFFNFGEKPAEDKWVVEGFKMKSVRFTEKVDGSLIIRSVIDGKVHFRTRGCEVIASDMRDEVMETIHKKYWTLLDPKYHVPGQSMLMEFVSPKNQIVVRYDEPRLTHLGWSVFRTPNLIIIPPSREAYEHGVLPGLPEPVGMIEASFDSTELKALKDEVTGYEGQEGIVTWTTIPDGQKCRGSKIHLCKFKSAWYLRLHSLRSQATPRYLREFCYFNAIDTIEELREAFQNEGFDWEVVSYIEPMFDEFQRHVDEVDTVVASINVMMDDEGIAELPTRKDIALKAKEMCERRLGPDGGKWFGYVMTRALGEPVGDHVGAMKMEMSLVQFRNFKKSGPEKLGSGKVIDDG